MIKSEEAKERRRQKDRKRYTSFVLKCHNYINKGSLLYCIECETTKNLEISHNDPTIKTFDITTNQTKYSAEKWWNGEIPVGELLLELDKCSLRCEKCHLIYDKKLPKPVHGTISMYKHQKCRCNDCRKTNADANKRRAKANIGPYREYHREYMRKWRTAKKS